MNRIGLVLVALALGTLGCNLSSAGPELPSATDPLTPPVATLQPQPLSPVPPTATPVVLRAGVTPSLTPAAVLVVPTFTPTPLCLLRTDWPQYTVQPGETLSGLAAAVGLTTQALASANCLPPDVWLAAGQVLHVPGLPATGTALPVATPTPLCDAVFWFGPVVGDCPAGEAVDVQAAAQAFQGGTMLWRADRDEITILFGNGNVMIYSAAHVQGLPETPVEAQPPEGLQRPVSGFGRVWSAYQGVREALGWALGPEQAYTMRAQPISPEIAPSNIMGYLTAPFDMPLYYLTLPDGTIVRLGLHAWWAL
ncbi:MAG: hypothetical protein Kow0077_00630 [Anaerolineae bacterium]